MSNISTVNTVHNTSISDNIELNELIKAMPPSQRGINHTTEKNKVVTKHIIHHHLQVPKKHFLVENNFTFIDDEDEEDDDDENNENKCSDQNKMNNKINLSNNHNNNKINNNNNHNHEKLNDKYECKIKKQISLRITEDEIDIQENLNNDSNDIQCDGINDINDKINQHDGPQTQSDFNHKKQGTTSVVNDNGKLNNKNDKNQTSSKHSTTSSTITLNKLNNLCENKLIKNEKFSENCELSENLVNGKLKKNFVNKLNENDLILNNGDLLDDSDDMDPYAELEIYLEKVKNEITEVFERLKIEEKILDNDKSKINHNNKKIATTTTNHIKTSKNVKDKDENDEIISSIQQQQLRNLTENASHIQNDRDLDRITSKYGKDEDLKAKVWAVDVMGELNNLVQKELKNLNRNKNGDCNLKQESTKLKHNNLSSKGSLIGSNINNSNNNDNKKPPSGNNRNPRIIRHLDSLSKESSYILKIDENYPKQNEYIIENTREIGTQTSPFLFNFDKITEWNSEESIVRSNGTTDEDNKSTSSSACEDVSAVLSSGKSGNSLDSSELDNNESGIGTASPSKDPDSWSRQSQSSQNNSLYTLPSLSDRNNWVRRENVTTQTFPSIIRSLKPIRRNSGQSDPDFLDVLSLYDENLTEDVINEQNHEVQKRFEEYSKQYYENNMEMNFCTDSSSASINVKGVDDDYDNVTFREKNDLTLNTQKRNLSLPISYNRKHCNVLGKHSSSLPTSESKSYTKINERQLEYNKRPNYLTIDQDPFQSTTSSNMYELPSPSSASLHSGHGNIVLLQELGTKSNSAPVLLKKDQKRDLFHEQKLNLRYSRSQSDRLLAEIEAIEACKWLRAAGFPQYAQMYEDLQFPIDLSNVAKDHSFLEHDPLQSLYRRLVILNQCATMRLDGTHKHGKNNDESDDESYALSENWTFQPQIRRWSRVGDQFGLGVGLPQTSLNNNKEIKLFGHNEKLNILGSRESSPERLEPRSMDTLNIPSQPFELNQDEPETEQIRFRRTGSERLKDGAKALLRRVESIKSRRKKRQYREKVVISGPQVLDLPDMNQRMHNLKCIDVIPVSNPSSPITPTPFPLHSPSRSPVRSSNELKVFNPIVIKEGRLSPNLLSPKHGFLSKSKDHHRHQSHSNRTSPLHFFTQNTNFSFLKDTKSGDDSSSYCSDGSQDSEIVKVRKKPSRARRFLQRGSKVEDTGALSDSECHPGSRKKKYFKDGASNRVESKSSSITRGGSLNLGKDSKRYRDALQQRNSRSRSLMRRQEKNYNQTQPDSDNEDEIMFRTKNSVVRWHSFQSSDRSNYQFRRQSIVSRYSADTPIDDIPLAAMSCGQLQVIRKLALVTLTGYMESHCPTHRSGWNWELPKFIKKIKTTNYKDKKVFGVPLLLISQRSGQMLPKSIYAAIKWLRLNALDHVGLFRKSGAQPRIQKLKAIVETYDSDSMAIFDGQQGYDVADMVKQYFRELPECLLTNKMSETFIAIFQHLPQEIRMEAVYAAIILLPDENREVLNFVLEFLNQVAENSSENRMPASNLGMCFGPTLLNTSFGNGLASPKRRKGNGVPDARELSETLASQNCLTFLIQNYRKIFTITREKMLNCNFTYMEESKPVTLEQLGSGIDAISGKNWKGYLCECTAATMKEGKEKSRGWFSVTSFEQAVEIAYKKVGDNHPLRLWRCITEVEAPPQEVLHLILRERRMWDQKLLKWNLIEELDNRSEIVQYVCGDQTITDYCVLRSWRSDLPRGACVIVETSIEHPAAKLTIGDVRGVVLASRYLIEPAGSGKSRIMHLSRVDMKGKSPEWYNKCFGHIISQYLVKIRSFFKHSAEGPESKV